jgi:hypothetical protein
LALAGALVFLVPVVFFGDVGFAGELDCEGELRAWVDAKRSGGS